MIATGQLTHPRAKNKVLSKTTDLNSATPDPSIVNKLKVWAPYRPSDNAPSRYEVDSALCFDGELRGDCII